MSHRVDYALRALTLLTTDADDHPGRLSKRESLAERAVIPSGFLDDILRDLRNAGLLRSQRGPDGGWGLTRPPEEITAADIIRALEGPLASVRGIPPHELPDHDVDPAFVQLWIALRASMRQVLEAVTLRALADDALPEVLRSLVDDPVAWQPHQPIRR